ncbi:MAG TPA: efflux RND transporter periplasmic adaptor subunit [Steroidobacteraceae bacterium]|nr:efflux RND transporter periplasmic adaptor subunit [Steroidobacteraceae bacterium]HRX87991.1 efflux RND transporter periplasmic adaptor subunit [Steroidobacteraceae bacterium]
MEKKKRPRWLWLTGIALLVVILLGVLLLPKGIVVETATIERGPLVVSVDEQGRTRARDRYTVAAPVTGRLLRTKLDAGDTVTAGDVVARIAPPPADARASATLRNELAAVQARSRATDAALREAEGAYQLAREEASRRADLFAKGLVSAESRDIYVQKAAAARARATSARASAAAARADVDSARSRLLGTSGSSEGTVVIEVHTPVSGTILRVVEESERVVQAGTPLFELSGGEGLELIVDLLTEDAVKVRPGNEIRVTGWGGERVLPGRVRYVEPGAFTKISTLGVEEQRVNVIGDLIDPPAELGAGYRIEAAIVVWTGENVLKIPTSAVFRRQNAWHTFTVADGRARLQAVEIGQRGSDYAELRSGLDEGATVIIFPSDLIEDGVRVANND